VSVTALVDSVGVNVLYVVNDPGQLVLALHSDADNRPGTVISQFNPIVLEPGWLVGSPTSNAILEPGIVYWVVASSSSSGGSVELEHDNEGTYPFGENFYSYDAGKTWTPRPTATTDLIFKVSGRLRN